MIGLKNKKQMSNSYPQFIQFFPTLRCNDNCSFCFNRGIKINNEIKAIDYKHIINKLADAGIKEIDILGGEPTLHPEILHLIDIPIKQGMHVFMSSNGSDVSVLNALTSEYCNSPFTLGISINKDEISDELNYFIVKNKPILKSICTPGKIMPDAVRNHVKSGIKCLLLFMDTLSKDELKNSLPFYEFLQRLNSLKNRYKNIDGVYCSGFISNDAINVRCPAGTKKLSVLPDGSVFPCYLLARHKEFRLGNIFEESLKTIIKNPALNFFRRFEKNVCPKKKCKVFASCHGGCPAISLLVCGDLNAPDPRCKN